MSDTPLLTNQLCFAINETHKLFNKFYHSALKPFGLSYSQYTVLLLLWEKDKRPLKELAQLLTLQSNTLTPLLRRMEEQGWVLRQQPREDRRQLYISLSTKAQTERAAILAAVQNCANQLTSISKEEFLQQLAFLEKLQGQLRKIETDNQTL